MVSRNKLLLLVAVAATAVVVLTIALGMVAWRLFLRPRPVECWLTLRYQVAAENPGGEVAPAGLSVVDILRARLEVAGTRGASVRQEGKGEFAVTVPVRKPRWASSGGSDQNAALTERIEQTSKLVNALVTTCGWLTFHPVDACEGYANNEARWQEARKIGAGKPLSSAGFILKEYEWSYSGAKHTELLLLRAKPVTGGANITKATVVNSESGKGWEIMVYLDVAGTRAMESYTDPGNSEYKIQHGRDRLAIVLDGVVQSAPVVESQLGGIFEITGNFTREEADRLCQILNSGVLPCKLLLVSETKTDAPEGK